MATQFSGGTYVSTTFTGNTRQDIQSNLKTQLVTAGWSNIAQASGQGPGNVGTVTMTIASPCVVTFTGHGFLGNERVILQTTGALPTGLSTNTVYTVRNATTNTFELSSNGGASSINTSGSQSGTHTLNTESVLLESATQSYVTNPLHVRLKDNRANCLTVSIENYAGSVVGGSSTNNGGYLLPASAKTFRVIATKYHWLCFTPGASAAREFVMAGALYVPSFLSSVTDIGYMFTNVNADGTGSVSGSFRTGPNACQNSSGSGNFQVLYNSNIIDVGFTNLSGQGGVPSVVTTASTTITSGGNHYRWANDDLNTGDVLLSWGLSSTSDEGKIKGQFYDMVYIADAFAGDSTDTFNGHNWYNITNNASGWPRGGMWVATS